MKNCLYTKGINLFEKEITPELIEQVRQLIENDVDVTSLMKSDIRMWNVFWRTEGYKNERKMSEMYGRPVHLINAEKVYIKCFPDILQRLMTNEH